MLVLRLGRVLVHGVHAGCHGEGECLIRAGAWGPPWTRERKRMLGRDSDDALYHMAVTHPSRVRWETRNKRAAGRQGKGRGERSLLMNRNYGFRYPEHRELDMGFPFSIPA